MFFLNPYPNRYLGGFQPKISDRQYAVHSLPTRAEMRNWLLDRFPVQFELLSVEVERQEFAKLLEGFEFLYSHGFTKSEILEGNYNVVKFMQIDYMRLRGIDTLIAPYRKTALLELAAFVGQKREIDT